MPTNFEFLPGLFRFRQFCEQKADEISERERRMELSKRRPVSVPYSDVEEDSRPSYTGPIEDIKPGDVLDQSRFPEYREFMKNKKGIPNIKMWGRHEDWEDNKHRPFGGGWEQPKPILPPKENKIPVAWALSKEVLAAKHGITAAIDSIPDQKDYDWKKPALNIPKVKDQLSDKPELGNGTSEPNPFEN